MYNPLLEPAKAAAKKIKAADKVKVVTHIDADGICAGSIASAALKRMGKEHTVVFVKQLDDAAISRVKAEKFGLAWFTDLGSGALEHLAGIDKVICDHHVPNQPHGQNGAALAKEAKLDLLKFAEAVSEEDGGAHVNPNLFGRNGSTDCSGAGATYLVARCLDDNNTDLSAIAIVGAVGDLQDSDARMLTGTNRDIIEDAVKAGVISVKTDARFFGKETRPIFKMLQYSTDPRLPGITGDERRAMDFLAASGVKQKSGESWRAWRDLDAEEKRTILSNLAEFMLEKGEKTESVERLVGESYYLIKEEPGTELHEAKEFATLLNSCGRYGHTDVGYNVCLGDRKDALSKARGLQRGHRETLVDSLNLIKDIGIKEMAHLNYVHCGDKVIDSVIGTVVNMALSANMASHTVPIVGFADTEDEHLVKASARCDKKLVRKEGAELGVDLSIAMKQAAEGVGGMGGGHNVAAGATIPKGKEEEFLSALDKILAEQTGK